MGESIKRYSSGHHLDPRAEIERRELIRRVAARARDERRLVGALRLPRGHAVLSRHVDGTTTTRANYNNNSCTPARHVAIGAAPPRPARVGRAT